MSTEGVALPVVSTEWVESHLEDDGLLLLDCSWSTEEDMEEQYTKCHIPSAQFFHPMYQAVPSALYPRPVPDHTIMEPYIQSLGISTESHVVLYDKNGHCGYFVAGRAWWMLKYFGLKNVSIMDGGFQKWQKEGRQTSDKVSSREPGNFKIVKDPSLLATFEEMEENLNSKQYQVVDTRPPPVYSGSEDQPQSGHYPGAINLPFHGKLLNMNTGIIRNPDEVKEALNTNNINITKPIIATCNSGMSSATLILSSQMLGFKAKLYVTGMVEWSQRKPDALVKGEAKE